MVDGLSHAFDCGFVTCGDDTKISCLGVDRKWLAEYGAVSRSGRRDVR
ncbi:CinA family protein [Paracoccus litorisediminis]